MNNNKLIAEFMGVPQGKHTHFMVEPFALESYADVDDLKYDASWDWLMPAVQKIESLGYVFTIQGGKAEYGEMISETRCFIVEDKLSSTYKAVVEFIKEHNDGDARTD
jgi:hypothetical protein